MGLRSDAFLAGYMPKMTPMDAEKKKARRTAGIETEVAHPATPDMT